MREVRDDELLADAALAPALIKTIKAVATLGKMLSQMPGAQRRLLKEAEADLEEAAQLLGMLPLREVERPGSAWPEGEGE